MIIGYSGWARGSHRHKLGIREAHSETQVMISPSPRRSAGGTAQVTGQGTVCISLDSDSPHDSVSKSEGRETLSASVQRG